LDKKDIALELISIMKEFITVTDKMPQIKDIHIYTDQERLLYLQNLVPLFSRQEEIMKMINDLIKRINSI
jgi:hypothetical protein